MLKIISVLFICSLFISCNDEYKSENNIQLESGSIDTLKIIDEIKKKISEIDSNLINYEKVEKVEFEETTEGAQLIGYFEGNTLKKISGIFYGETGRTEIDFYCSRDSCFLINSKSFLYEKPIYIDNTPEIKDIKENNYYFYNGELIKWISDSNITKSVSADFEEKNSSLRKDFNKYKNMLTNN